MGNTNHIDSNIEASFKGHIAPNKAWEILSNDNDAQLIDVRTNAEWVFVGLPNLSSLSKKVKCITWRTYPSMEVNGNFIKELQTEIPNKNAPLLFLCRSGSRSYDAAMEASIQGFKNCYNIEEGFEGEADSNNHRGKSTGWKAAQLPWEQQ